MILYNLAISGYEDLFNNRLEELKNEFLIPRNFKPKLIDAEFEKVRNLPGDSFKARRKQALLKVKRNVKDPQRIIEPVDFNPQLPNVSQILKKHHKSMLIRASHLKEVLKEAPMASYRQASNLKRLLCKSKLHQLSKTE